MGDYPKAMSFYEKRLEISRANHKEDYGDMASSYNSIGGMYEKMGEYSKAFSFAHTSIFPSDHVSLAGSYDNFALAYYRLDQSSEAFSFCRKVLPKYHPDLIESYIGVAWALFMLQWADV